MFINWSLSSFLEMLFLFIAALVLMVPQELAADLVVSACPLLGYAVDAVSKASAGHAIWPSEQYGPDDDRAAEIWPGQDSSRR